MHAILTSARFAQALLSAMAQGDTIRPAPAPSVMDTSGGVKIPPRWEHQIRKAMDEVTAQKPQQRPELE